MRMNGNSLGLIILIFLMWNQIKRYIDEIIM